MINSVALCASLLLLCASCGNRDEPASAAAPAQPTPLPEASPPGSTVPPPTNANTEHSATVELKATEGSDVSGTITFTTDEGEHAGVRVSGTVRGLEPNSEHGFHVHETGDCSAPDASSAGGHFSPLKHPHGPPGMESHVGDMGNITADAQGVASVDARAPLARITGLEPTNIRGRAVIVHARRDDLSSQPSGDAGARLACGVIPQWPQP